MPEQSNRYPTFEFHISRRARDRYQFNLSLFSLSGNVVFANFYAARIFAQRMNEKRDLVRFPETAVKAGQINAMGLIDEILHYVAGEYRKQRNPKAMAEALEFLESRLDREAVDLALARFCEEFPPIAVYRGETDVATYLAGESAGISNRQIALEEMMMLWLANVNPAMAPYQELFDDSDLSRETSYKPMMAGLQDYFATQPPYGPDNQSLIDMLRSPAIAVPHSLSGQLEYILTRWGFIIGKYFYRLLSSLDLIKEEQKAIFLGPGPARVYEFRGMESEIERFSPDKDWMPRLVLIAKNTYVWLDQLTKEYKRPIQRLNEVPDEELERLAKRGFTGLWLIGLWERSKASQRIKQIMGNPEAVASAYSLYDYQIAWDLGGEEAYNQLKDRAWKYGIRMASDMVPNHMGIDSRWVMEHPDWFVGLDYPPFPSYSFNGANLSDDGRAAIQIEDHYYTRSDAAVVFKRYDYGSGQTRFIYHGNDGTSMPWNDTAQLNYLMPEVREAVIQTILAVARRSPIIRFDAAMTLAKKHYQRLWYPEPGSGGDIASRAEHGLTREQFDAAMPEEFWREVVDRVAKEAPDTLLLAEAFWLMEGYFVRSLGMHRVYNSAFMNMLRDEKNAEYRQLIKNTLEFDPQILKRYVNFMNNPDERTAVDQFGKGDKYFGIATMMSTLPGLPMFGHGQVEGYAEKYGMEFRRAYWEEYPDGGLVERHEREVSPVLHRRYIFAEVENFLLYDFYTIEGWINENVYAYSNRAGDQRGLVLYHNRYESTRGWIRTSAAYLEKGHGLVQKSLGEGLALRNDENSYTIFRDHHTGLEYIRNNRELCEKGLYAELGAYQYQIFVDFREVYDNEWRQYGQLTSYLNGRGVPNIDEALREIFLEPVHRPFRNLVSAGAVKWMLDEGRAKDAEGPSTKVLDQVEEKLLEVLRAIKQIVQGNGDEVALAHEIREELAAALSLPILEERFPLPRSRKYAALLDDLKETLGDARSAWSVLFGWIFTHSLGKLVDEVEYVQISCTWIDEWLLGKILTEGLRESGLEEHEAWRAVQLIKVLIAHQKWFKIQGPAKQLPYRLLENGLKRDDIQRYIGVNRYQEVLWFNQESFDTLLQWMTVVAVVQETVVDGEEKVDAEKTTENLLEHYDIIAKLKKAEKESGYKVENLLEAARGK